MSRLSYRHRGISLPFRCGVVGVGPEGCRVNLVTNPFEISLPLRYYSARLLASCWQLGVPLASTRALLERGTVVPATGTSTPVPEVLVMSTRLPVVILTSVPCTVTGTEFWCSNQLDSVS
jgi:hypothetical protein